MSSNSLNLPAKVDAKSNKILMFDCLLLLGDELGSYYDVKMRSLRGEDWLRILAQERNDYNLTLNDPDFVIKEPLRSDSPLRAILPKSTSFYRNLDILRKVRNHIAHNKTEGKLEQTREILEVMLAVAMDIDLKNCVNEYAGAIKRIEDITQGVVFNDDLGVTNRVQEFEERSAEIEEMLFEEKLKSAEVAQLLEEARSVVVIKELEFETLEQSDKAKIVVIKEMENELNRARKEAQDLKTQLDQNTQRTDDLKRNEISLKNLVASLAAPVTESSVLGGSTLKMPGEELRVISRKENSTLEAVQGVGTIWNHPKGSRKIVLSVSSRDLTDTKSGKLLEKVDAKLTKELAEEWLKIRPQGGRVFIDSEGHASTLIDDRLVYLGNVAFLFS
jgi:hypothetical protein